MAKKEFRKNHKLIRRHPKAKRNNFQSWFVALLLLGGYLIYRLILNNFSAPLQIAEIKNDSGTVNLTIQAAKTDLAPNEETTITVTYDSPTNKLTVINGEISYDPTIVTVSNFTRGSGFPTELVAANASNGKIAFTYGVAVAAGSGLTGQGTILTFTAKALVPGNATLAFTDVTDARVTSVSTNALREITNTTLTIADHNLSPSPSPSADIASPSPSASPSISPSPSASPSLSPSTSAPVVVKPSAPSNLRYNCYSNGTRITLRWDTVTDATGYEIVFDQKDGDNNQTKSSTRAEIDLDIKNNTYYTWKVATKKDAVMSDYSTVNDIKCNSDQASNNATPTPTPSPSKPSTPTPTPKKSTAPLTQKIVNVFKKSPTPSPSPRPSIIASSTPTPTPGSLSDVFGSPVPSAATSSAASHSLWEKIVLGWQALFYRIVESMTR